MHYGRTVAESLTAVMVRFRRDPLSRSTLKCPVLLWEASGQATSAEHWETTRGPSANAPTVGDPRVLRVEKASKTQNAFAFGITLGRVDNNDLVLDDHSVSRFHAFLRYDDRAQTWFLTDAESKNGTWVDGNRLGPNQPTALRDEAVLKLGDAQLRFMLPASFFKMVDAAPGSAPLS